MPGHYYIPALYNAAMKISVYECFSHTHMHTHTHTHSLISYLYVHSNRGVGTGPAGPATAGPKFPEPTIKNIIPLFVIKQIRIFCITVACVYTSLIKQWYYYIIERTRH